MPRIVACGKADRSRRLWYPLLGGGLTQYIGVLRCPNIWKPQVKPGPHDLLLNM